MKMSRTAESALKFKDTVAQMDRPSCLSQVGGFLFFELPIHYNKTSNMKKMNFLIWVMQVVYWTFTRATNPIDSGQSLRLQRLKHIVIRIKSIKLCFTLQYWCESRPLCVDRIQVGILSTLAPQCGKYGSFFSSKQHQNIWTDSNEYVVYCTFSLYI